MFSVSAVAGRLSAGRGLPLWAAIAVSLWMLGMGSSAMAEPASAPRDFSGWRGGIGITFGTPSRDIADVTEMGYEIVWGGEDPRAIKALGISVFRYWNSIVETSLKGSGYDFSRMPDKDEAAKLAFDAWMERAYGVKGLSKYANVRYNPKGAYGDVYGSMDLSSENDLVKAVIARYMQGFDKDGITHGGIGLDNAGKVPREFLEALARRLNARGLGIAANGCPDQYLTYIDFFGNEGFPFSINYARQAREKGLRGILGEFTMQHLSGGEMDAYLKSKLFNGIVFFGYTNGGTAAGASYSAYCSRPDVYNHQRWVLRKLVPISRAVQRAGRQMDPAAKLASAAAPASEAGAAPAGVAVNAEGKVEEVKRREAGLDRITGRFAGDDAAASSATGATSPTASTSSWTRGSRRKWSAMRRNWACARTPWSSTSSPSACWRRSTPQAPSPSRPPRAPAWCSWPARSPWRRASWHASRRTCACSSPSGRWIASWARAFRTRRGRGSARRGSGTPPWRTPARAAWRWWAAPTPPRCPSGSTSTARARRSSSR